MAVRGGTSVIDFQHPKTCAVVDGGERVQASAPARDSFEGFHKGGLVAGAVTCVPLATGVLEVAA